MTVQVFLRHAHFHRLLFHPSQTCKRPEKQHFLKSAGQKKPDCVILTFSRRVRNPVLRQASLTHKPINHMRSDDRRTDQRSVLTS